MSCNVNNEEFLTTDAVPDAPRNNKTKLLIDEDTNNHTEKNTDFVPQYPANSKKKNTHVNSSSTYASKPKKKSSSSSRNGHACTKVINILNSSAVHVGTVNNYNLYSNVHKKKGEPTERTVYRDSEVDRILSDHRNVTKDHIDFVATHLGEGWRDVGQKLGYSKGQMDHFYEDNKINGDKEVVYQMLLDWTRMKPDDSKICTLATALWDSKQEDVVCRWSKSL